MVTTSPLCLQAVTESGARPEKMERERELQKESEREFHERLQQILHTELNICKYGTQKENYTITLRRVISRKRFEIDKLLLYRDFKSPYFITA